MVDFCLKEVCSGKQSEILQKDRVLFRVRIYSDQFALLLLAYNVNTLLEVLK